jgi:hypothetical protein
MSVWVGVATFALASCGGLPEGQVPVHPARGRVLLDGKPVADALVVFHASASPTKSDIPRPTGRTDSQGHFVLHTYAAYDGAPAGHYRVAITISPAPADTADLLERAAKKETIKATPDHIKNRYGDPTRSGLEAEIKPGDNRLTDFALKAA